MKIITVLLVLLSFSVCMLKCTNKYARTQDARGPQYAGAASCVQCHKNITDHYTHTNHFNTSSKVDFEKFKQLITALNDTVHFPNGQLVKLEAVHNKLAQSYILKGQQVNSETMDIAFGSGEKAWTFGYWKDEALYELPLTYLTELKRWTNSPGLRANQPDYARLIVSRCMECHSSYAYAEKSLEQGMRYTEKIDPATIIYGIDCERCHGPAAQHVAFHTEHPGVRTAKYMVPIKSLSRQQQLDLCATCHSGDPVELRTIFAFKPGDTLSHYYMYYPGAAANPDAHGMQMQSLMQSKCFLQSNLTCMNCHDTHMNERNSREVFVQRCMSCHQQSAHAVTMRQANNYCINCHMPLQASKSLNFGNSAERSDIQYRLRTHHIAIYPASKTQ
ncbi:hypothetical protein A8C56_02495 [Niabella ginsenosidivorans]|uniref:Cytochrome c-552/4 domain-containing protein n=1 Tax=Niabella ginsenosidivorans TaxID=1176587 RepID=A0A1A9I0B5_9BACT|nr:multiheme c-type cytochrome [Niabella ginsenosidivorans]ANH79994.1 hypothetical protein A8C56_02495 [Niabella ginsenosidivorans]